MVFVGDRMDVGLQLFSPSPRSYTATGTPTNYFNSSTGQFTFGIGTGNQSIDSENSLFLIPSFGYSKALDSVSSVGIAVYGNGGMNTEYKGGVASADSGAFGMTPGTPIQSPGTYGAGTAGVNLAQLFVNGSYARKLDDKNAVGASLIFAYQRFMASGLDAFAGFSADPSNLSGNRKSDSSGFGFKLGYQGEVAPGVRVGASYQSKMSMSKFSEYTGLFANGGSFDIPSTYTVGAEFDAGPTGKVVADIQKINYSEVDSIANPISNLTTSCQPGPTGGTGPGCLGSSNGAGFGWKDMTIVKLGYQWTADNTDWRVGVSKGKQPIPDSEVTFNILAPAVIETHFTFGMTKQMANNQEFNLAAMYAPSHEVSGPNAFDPAQTIKLKMSQLDLQVGWAWKY
jgi:long-chain fatty acid transport protein